LSDENIRNELKSWILKKNPKIQATDLLDSTPILEKRILKSLDVMDLILKIEKLGGGPVDVETIKPGSFKSIDVIMEVFFKEVFFGGRK
jgi:acyl carrier protein